jgi:nucleoside-diphosphate-sugar epimerase
MNVFMTGASGVIGRRAIPMLRRAGHTVTAAVHSEQSRERLTRMGISTVAVSLFDHDALARSVRGHDAVINLATHIPHSSLQMFLPGAWRENDRIRRHGAAALVDACVAGGVPRLIQESFAPVYPDCGERWIDEHTPLRPVRYNQTVADAEASAGRFQAFGRDAVILRFGGFYGSDAWQTREMVRWVKRGWGPLPGRCTAYISSVSHDDAAAAVTAALSLPSGAYNVVDDEPVTHREFIDTLAAALEARRPKLPPLWLTPLFGSLGQMMARSLRISNRKLRSVSTWTPKYPSIRQGWRAVVSDLAQMPPETRGEPAPRVNDLTEASARSKRL